MLTELVPDRVYVFSAPTNSGIFVDSSCQKAIMIDSGIDDAQARKIYRHITQEFEMELTDVLTTHAHADHCGGHFWLQKKGVRVFAPPFEESWVNHPIHMSYGLFGGARPPKELQNKFLKASETKVDDILTVEQENEKLSDYNISLTSLPGHSMGQIGIICHGVFFVGDAIFTPEVFTKHNQLPFNVDIEQVRSSLEKIILLVEKHEIEYLVPGHGDVITKVELNEIISQYKQVLDKNVDEIVEFLREKGNDASSDEIVARILKSRGTDQIDKGLYFLNRATIQANLVYLEESGKISSRIEEGKLVYSCN